MCTGLKTGALTLVLLATASGVLAPAAVESSFSPAIYIGTEKIKYRLPLGAIVVNSNSILQAKSPNIQKVEQAPKFLVYVTAYSSSVDETDSTPFITASGTETRDGVIASNIFSLGTRVRVPQVFGDKVFVVEDRMHERFTNRIDIWMPSKWQALNFGKKQAEVEIIEL